MLSSVADLWRGGRLGKQGAQAGIVFGRVQEDAAVELRVSAAAPAGDTFCIGSGGCTAFSLLLGQLRSIHVVDINPAQTALIELKRAALQALGHPAACEAITRRANAHYGHLHPLLSDEARHFWDAHQALLNEGLEQAGQIERLMRRGRWLFHALVHPRSHTIGLLNAATLEEQRQEFASRWDTWRWRLFLAVALSKPALLRVYGGRFVDPLPDDFGQFIREELHTALTCSLARNNGYIWQAFTGRYPDDPEGLPLYLQAAHYERVRANLGRLQVATSEAGAYLAERRAGSFGFFALSNILEVCSEEDARDIVSAVSLAAAPKALVCMRWILPPPQRILSLLENAWSTHEALASEVRSLDRSLFCRSIRVYRT